VVSGEVALVIGVRMMLVLRRMYVVVEGIAAKGGVEVVGKAIVAIEVVVYVLVMAGVYGLEAVSEVSEVYEV